MLPSSNWKRSKKNWTRFSPMDQLTQGNSLTAFVGLCGSELGKEASFDPQKFMPLLASYYNCLNQSMLLLKQRLNQREAHLQDKIDMLADIETVSQSLIPGERHVVAAQNARPQRDDQTIHPIDDSVSLFQVCWCPVVGCFL